MEGHPAHRETSGHWKPPEARGCLVLLPSSFCAALLQYLVASQMEPRGWMADLRGEMPPFDCPHDCSENRVLFIQTLIQ